MKLVVTERCLDDLEHAERAHRDLLRSAFSPDELPPFERFLSMFGDESLVVLMDGDDMVAAAVSDHLISSPLGLLSYLAVRPDRRNLGIGLRLMLELRALWSEGRAEVVLGEVHDPRSWATTDQERPRDRLRFYERCGARLLGCPWAQPALAPGLGRVRGMLLLTMGGRRRPHALPAADVATWMIDYYRAAEGTADREDDADLSALLQRVEASPTVPILPIQDLDLLEPLAHDPDGR